MSPQLRSRASVHNDDPNDIQAWSILLLADLLSERNSTTTRLGMPFAVPRLDDAPFDTEGMTGAFASWGDQFWRIEVSSTDTGITYSNTPRPVRESVQMLRDDIALRTRLTREQIARAIGVDRRSLSAWVKGASTPGADKLERLQQLADVVRDIDATGPGRATEVLLSRSDGQDLLDHIAAGRLTRAHDWRLLLGSSPSVMIEHRSARKRPLHSQALEAYLRGELHPIGRAATLRPESDYEQDLTEAERLMPDEPLRNSRRGYR